jgi:galactose mutarotase-like enzyme
LRSPELQATFEPRDGMAGRSLRHHGAELLAVDGIPLLYPWANRLAGFEYEVLGRRVELDPGSPLLERDQNSLPIHGLLRAWAEWQVIGNEEEGLEMSLDFGAQPRLLAAFPFPHELRLEARLEGARLEITTSVNANQDSAVPVSFGYHPYFTLPGVPREEWLIEVPVGESLVLGEGMIPTGERRPVRGLDGPLGERSFDDGYASVDHARPFAVTGGDRRIEVRFDERFPFAQVYSPPGGEFICFEPMTAPTNALRSGIDLPVAAAGETFAATWSISVTAA